MSVPDTATDLFLDVRSVHKRFGENVVLAGVDLAVPRGSVVTVLGKSGTGKSVFLNCLAGIVRPDAGEICFDGNALNAANAAARAEFRRRCSYLFQSNALLDSLTALENVALPLMIRRNQNGNAFKHATNLLEQTGLGGRLDHPVSHLSGGEQQRVAVARALITEPQLVLADEPTGNLDLSVGEEIGRTLAGYARTHAAIVIIATHSPTLAQLCDYSLELEQGRLKL